MADTQIGWLGLIKFLMNKNGQYTNLEILNANKDLKKKSINELSLRRVW